jgi:membrane-associated phospholipid phosphatase
LLVVAWHSAPSAAAALGWGLLAVLFASIAPFLYIVGRVRRRDLTDHHVGDRAQRPVPLAIAVVSMVTGLGLLATAGAPRELVAVVGAVAAGLALATLVTLLWKISIHAATVAGSLTILALAIGPVLLALAPIVVLVGWARVELRDHTLGQVLAGSGLGIVVAAAVFSVLR